MELLEYSHVFFYVLSVDGLVQQKQNRLEGLQYSLALYRVDWLTVLLSNHERYDGSCTYLMLAVIMVPLHRQPRIDSQRNPHKHSHFELISSPLGIIMKSSKMIQTLYTNFPT